MEKHKLQTILIQEISQFQKRDFQNINLKLSFLCLYVASKTPYQKLQWYSGFLNMCKVIVSAWKYWVTTVKWLSINQLLLEKKVFSSNVLKQRPDFRCKSQQSRVFRFFSNGCDDNYAKPRTRILHFMWQMIQRSWRSVNLTLSMMLVGHLIRSLTQFLT